MSREEFSQVELSQARAASDRIGEGLKEKKVSVVVKKKHTGVRI